jgi:uncharacterized membrane protein YhaH (DUF805 family)
MLDAYFGFSGRMRRFRLLIYSVLLIVLLAVIGIAGSLALDAARSVTAAKLFVEGLLALLWLWAWAAMGVKRLHDLNKPGWHFLWLILAPQALMLGAGTSDFRLNGGGDVGFNWSGGFLSLVGLIWLLLGILFLLLARGTDGPNRFGYPP